MYGYIYKTTNLLNQKVYIGKKESSSFVETYLGSGTILAKAIKKYGRENFKVEIISWAANSKELDDLEKKLIRLYSETHTCYNIAAGGTGGNTTSLHPLKTDIIKKRGEGVKKWHDSLTEDEKALRGKRISQSKKGKSNGHKGFKHSKETKEKISKSNMKINRASDSVWRGKHTEAMAKRKGKPLAKKYKSVIIDNIHYPSIKDAMISLGIKHRATFYDRINRGILKVIYK
jgi:group I intron endonuclease